MHSLGKWLENCYNGSSNSGTTSDFYQNERAYPRPQLQRSHWMCLNGSWKFTFDDDGKYTQAGDISEWAHTIQVPFAPETAKSGIGDTGFHPNCWYEREFDLPKGTGDWELDNYTNSQSPNLNSKTENLKSNRVLLHFGAVDYRARVWVNGQFMADHEGGHTPFSIDITPVLNHNGPQRVTVWAEDDPHDLAKPRGKQDWQLEAHSIWYPRTSGIWQTVWAEIVPSTYIDRIRWTPHFQRWEIGFEAFVAGEKRDGIEIKVKLSVGCNLLVNDIYEVIHGEIHRRIALSDPGIDDYRNELLWSPEKPTLIDAEVQLWSDGELLDEVKSYTAMRTVGVQRDRFMLNGRPYYLRLVLDQGYWPDTFMTAPSDEALRRDVELVKAMGFNGVRKHQKIEDPRFLYWADVLGLMVWEEMPSAYRFTPKAVERLTKEWTEVINRDSSHPCIVVWVPFNESWGVPDLTATEAHRHLVQALYHLTKTLDPTRPVVGNDGWESTATDILAIHDYDNKPTRLAKRYGPEVKLSDLFDRQRPGGRVLTLDGYPHQGQPIMLTEFGGIAYAGRDDRKAWGYVRIEDVSELQIRYTALLNVVNKVELFSGFCYTQLTDTFQEANGLLYADRTPKFPLEAIAYATLGRGEEDQEDAMLTAVKAAWAQKMYSQEALKPDGRKLTLYSRYPIAEGITPPSPSNEPVAANPHLRWHPLRGEWVAYASHRQGRTFMPPPEYNPLAPTKDPQFPTELPEGKYDVAVFDNRFPSMTLAAQDPPDSIVETLPSNGACEVVVFTQDPHASLGSLELDHLELLLQVWGDRTRKIGENPHIQYVLPFENKGVEVGVTLHHPHGQIYAYPFIPPVPAKMLEMQQAYYQEHQRSLLQDLIQKEIEDNLRILYRDEEAIAFVPVCARYPYEVWIAPIQPVATLMDLTDEQRSSLARALKTVTLKYDGLWNRPFPYLMAWFQAPTDEQPHPEAHLHAEFFPPYRTKDRLKYLAGTELAAGMFANDALPEEKAKELQAVVVNLETPVRL